MEKNGFRVIVENEPGGAAERDAEGRGRTRQDPEDHDASHRPVREHVGTRERMHVQVRVRRRGEHEQEPGAHRRDGRIRLMHSAHVDDREHEQRDPERIPDELQPRRRLPGRSRRGADRAGGT
jgi:hypothetical protein